MKTISLLLVDDHAMMREALAAIIGRHKDMRIVGMASDGREGAEQAAKLKPDVVTLDVAMPNLNGLDAIHRIRHGSAATRIIIVTAHEEDLYIEHALEAGVEGFVSKRAAAETLVAAIRAVAQGRKAFSPAVLKRLPQYEEDAKDHLLHRKQTERLSDRETEVLQLVAEGNANKQVAAHLGISIKTVEKHRQHLMEKLHIHDTAGLTRYAIAAGLVETPAGVAGHPELTPPEPKSTTCARNKSSRH